MNEIENRIKFLNNKISKEKGQISKLIFQIGLILIGTTLLGTGIGLIFGKLVKWVAISLASGMLLSIKNVTEIDEIVSKIDTDKRELITRSSELRALKERSKSKVKTDQVKPKTIKKDSITDEDMDRMIGFFKNNDYGFKHNPNEEKNNYDDEEQNRGKRR